MTPIDAAQLKRTCFSKHRYPTEPIAKQVIERRRKRGASNLRPYPCRHCGGYHITSKPKVTS